VKTENSSEIQTINIFEREGFSNKLLDCYKELHEMTEKGLVFHKCELFHDTLVSLVDLRKAGIPYRENLAGAGSEKAFPQFCPPDEQNIKLGCAHNGNIRIVNGHSRKKLLRSIQYLRELAPGLVEEKDLVALKKTIEELGTKIVEADVTIAIVAHMESAVKNIKRGHSDNVETLFNIACFLEEKLQEALRLGNGYTAITDEDDEEPIIP